MTTILDHLAVGTPDLSAGWDLFTGVLGGTWAYGGDSPGFWWGQLRYATGPKVELLKPTGGPDAAFLERFLDSRGPGPHHFNFLVTDIEETLARFAAAGLEPVGVNLANPGWKEAFLHPRAAHGIVIQVAQQAGEPASPPPAELPEPADDGVVELTWPGGKRIRLVREGGLPLGGSLHHIRFTRADGPFGARDRERAGLLAKRLGLTVELAG